jgi:hypothetical protein
MTQEDTMIMPSFEPSIETIRLPDGWDWKHPREDLFPPIKKMSDGRLLVDAWMGWDERFFQRLEMALRLFGWFAPAARYLDHVRARTIITNSRRVAFGKVWARADHPNLKALPAGVPRAVKSLYTADGQLAYIRGDYDRAIKAVQAWDDYALNSVELPELKRRIRLNPDEEHFSKNFDWSPSGVLWKRGERFSEFRP